MKKEVENFILSLIILTIVFLVFIPSFSSYALEKKGRRDNQIRFNELLKEQRLLLEEKHKLYLTGKFNPEDRDDFTLIPLKYMYSGNNMYLRQETLSAFIKMQDAAEKDGISLKISSATRNFDYQNDIWSKKWNGQTLVDGKKLPESMPSDIERLKKILEYSAAPSTSRHHWGTDIDINGADRAYFETQKGNKEYLWLATNAEKYGFCQVYNKKGEGRETGYNEERWHWSYLPIAKKLTLKYAQIVTIEDIRGFEGDFYIKELNPINNYVLNINQDCF